MGRNCRLLDDLLDLPQLVILVVIVFFFFLIILLLLLVIFYVILAGVVLWNGLIAIVLAFAFGGVVLPLALFVVT